MSLSAFTAYQTLLEHGDCEAAALEADLEAKMRNAQRSVLVTAASGGVGCWILQLAREAGVENILAVCGSGNKDFVQGLGATEVIDRNDTSIGTWVAANQDRKPHIVLDCVGGMTTAECWLAVNDRGILISIVNPPDATKLNDNVAGGVRSKFFVMEPKGEQLRVIGQLLESGKCHPAVDSVFPIESFQQAFDRVASGHARGKVIIEVST